MTDLQALFTQYIEGNAKEQERAAKQIAQTNGAQAFLMEKLSGAKRVLRWRCWAVRPGGNRCAGH